MNLRAPIPSNRFGHYTLIRKIGEGGMAEVFLAGALDAGGELFPVAIKLAKELRQEGVDIDELFATEADLMALLRHPRLVDLYEVGKVEGRFFLAMEFLSGGELAALSSALKRRGERMPAALALSLMLDVLQGLACVHRARGASGTPLQLVHGDVNPRNILLDVHGGHAKLGDFGVTMSRAWGQLLPEGMAVGKLNYLSPEQVTGKTPGPETDLFAVAVVLFELLFGVRPFDGEQQREVLDRIRQCRYDDSVDMAPWQRAFFERAFSKNPKVRFQTAGAMAGELVRHQIDEDLLVEKDEVDCFFSQKLEIDF